MKRTAPFSPEAIFNAGIAISVASWAAVAGITITNWDHPVIRIQRDAVVSAVGFKVPVCPIKPLHYGPGC